MTGGEGHFYGGVIIAIIFSSLTEVPDNPALT